jgi:hypothetical protein
LTFTGECAIVAADNQPLRRRTIGISISRQPLTLERLHKLLDPGRVFYHPAVEDIFEHGEHAEIQAETHLPLSPREDLNLEEEQMDLDATGTLNLMCIMQKLYNQGSHDAQVVYRILEPAWDELEHRNLWEADGAQTSKAVDIIRWIFNKEDMPLFENDWPQWLKTWVVTTHIPIPLRPLKFRRPKGSWTTPKT